MSCGRSWILHAPEMDAFLAMPADRRRVLCEEAGARLGLTAASIEKDYWACWTLRALFGLPKSGPHLTFKGGTSLSKGWKLIERFSEDLDIVIDREFLGFGGDHSPEEASSRKQQGKRLDELKEACQRHINEKLLPAFEAHVRATLRDTDNWRLEMDADDPDGQTLLFYYPTVTAATDYIGPVVKIELGARSDIDPAETPSITPYLADVFPDELPDSAFQVRAVAPERTLWEKVALLHEEGYRVDGGPKARLARHYYDISRLIEAGVADRALDDQALFERVVEHRKVFFKRSGAAQETLRPGSLRLLPSDDRRSDWARDFEAMREAMFFSDPPSFDEILAVVGDFERRFNEEAS